MDEHIKSFIGYYVVNYLIDNNIVEVSDRLVCPECRQFIPDCDFHCEVVCYHCGRIYSADSVIHEKVFIKL